jgi:cytochrome c
LLAAASAKSGKSMARKCAICHSLKKGGKARVGPALWGIVGTKKAAGSFRYSGALKGLGGVWDYAALNMFLANPKAFAPGNKMSSFAGIKKDTDRAALILYLRSLSDSPVPLP